MEVLLMINNKDKEEACRTFESYIKLIYWFGHGIMMSIHVQQYMERLEGKNKTQVWRDIRTLQSTELLDVCKLFNNNYVKLKKYSLRYLLSKESSKDTKSVNVGFTAIKRSAFINEFILRYPLKGAKIDDIINYYHSNTTLISRDKQNTAILQRFENRNIAIKKEIENLDTLAKQQLKNLQTKTPGTKIEKLNSFNLNNMQSRNIYISSIKEDLVKVVFLDLNDSYNAVKIAGVFEDVYLYLSTLFPDRLFVFSLIVSDNDNVIRIKKLTARLTNILMCKHLCGYFKFKIFDLDIRAKVFSNVKVLF
jgi:hypothetical protein